MALGKIQMAGSTIVRAVESFTSILFIDLCNPISNEDLMKLLVLCENSRKIILWLLLASGPASLSACGYCWHRALLASQHVVNTGTRLR